MAGRFQPARQIYRVPPQVVGKFFHADNAGYHISTVDADANLKGATVRASVVADHFLHG